MRRQRHPILEGPGPSAAHSGQSGQSDKAPRQRGSWLTMFALQAGIAGVHDLWTQEGDPFLECQAKDKLDLFGTRLDQWGHTGTSTQSNSAKAEALLVHHMF